MIKQSSKKLSLLCALVVWGFAVQAQNGANAGSVTPVAKTATEAKTVKGMITDAATKKPLRGIRVTYKTFGAAITDSTGSFTLKVPSYNVTIMVEGDGYQAKEIALKGRSSVSTVLYEDTYISFFDGAHSPMGTGMKSKSPFAITSLQTNGSWEAVSETPSTYLQGRVAGLNAIRRSGTPNIGASFTLRGLTSLYGSNQPLIVVDGVLFDNTDFGGSVIYNHYTDPLSTIDIKDIDNITVIKDGSSIYGTKGANGVILITTTRAKELSTRIDLAMYGGVNFTPQNLPVMKASDYRTYLSDLLKSKGMSDADIAAQPYMNDDPSNPDYYRYNNETDWQKAVFNRSYTRNLYLKVTGGDNIAKYGIALGYLTSGGITRNTDLTRYNMRFNGDLNLSKRMTATTNLSFTFNEQNLRDQGTASKTNPIFLALTKAPFLRIREVSDKGNESPLLADRDTFNMGNPMVLTDQAVGVNKNYRFFGSIGFNYEISRSLALSSTLGITNNKVRENFFVPRKGVTTDTLFNDIAYNRLGTNVTSLFSLYNDTRLSYHRTFKNVHDLSSRIGLRYLDSRAERDYGYGYNSAIDELISVGNGVNALRRVGGVNGEYNWLNTYFNTDYSYSDKYFLSLNVAMDGSSRFGNNIAGATRINGNNYAVLPSLAAAWMISSEQFMKNKPFDLLKLRASWGLTGNDDIGNYSSRQSYVSQNLLGLQGLVRGGLGNNQLQWEKNTKLNLGLDMAFLNERVSLSIDAYRNKIDKMITYEQVPAATGFNYAITNSGAMTTKGIEVALNTRIISKPLVKWDLGLTFGSYKSTIDALPGDPIITDFATASYITKSGGGPNQFFGYQADGVFSSDLEASQAGLSIRANDGSLMPFRGGDVRFADINGDKVIDARDRVVIGDPNPDFFGSVSNRVSYKNFSLDAMITFTKGNDLYNYTRNQLESMSNYSNQTVAVVNRWRTNGQVTDVPKATWGDPMGNSRFSDRWIEDGSYARLRSVTLTYQIPFRPGFFQYANVYITGNNLLTLTKYKGYDPEFSATESIFGQGVDNTLEPQFRSIMMGLRVGL